MQCEVILISAGIGFEQATMDALYAVGKLSCKVTLLHSGVRLIINPGDTAHDIRTQAQLKLDPGRQL